MHKECKPIKLNLQIIYNIVMPILYMTTNPMRVNGANVNFLRAETDHFTLELGCIWKTLESKIDLVSKCEAQLASFQITMIRARVFNYKKLKIYKETLNFQH